MTVRECKESPIEQGSDESVAYTIDFSTWGTPSSPTAKIYEWDGTDVTSTKMTGTASVDGDNIITPAIHSLTAGERFKVRVSCTVSGNLVSCFFVINCEF